MPYDTSNTASDRLASGAIKDPLVALQLHGQALQSELALARKNLRDLGRNERRLKDIADLEASLAFTEQTRKKLAAALKQFSRDFANEVDDACGSARDIREALLTGDYSLLAI